MNSSAEIQLRSSSLKTPGVCGGEIYLFISEHTLEGQGSLGEFSRNRGASRCHLPFPVQTQRHLREPMQCPHSLPNLLTAPPPPPTGPLPQPSIHLTNTQSCPVDPTAPVRPLQEPMHRGSTSMAACQQLRQGLHSRVTPAPGKKGR